MPCNTYRVCEKAWVGWDVGEGLGLRLWYKEYFPTGTSLEMSYRLLFTVASPSWLGPDNLNIPAYNSFL